MSFDRINHQALLHKLHTIPRLRRAIRAWLRAGVMDGETLFPTSEGTPQGGVLSPLLANIALHGLEATIREAFPDCFQYQTNWKPLVVRYADDFVVLHHDLAVIEQAQQLANAWLAGMGLELKSSKTRITHTLHEHNGHCGFDFLGFQVRQFPVGKTHSGRRGNGSGSALLGFKTLITPSRDALRRHARAVGEVIQAHQTAPQAALIARLNPLIRGWTTYYATVCAKAAFAKLAHVTFLQLQRWARRRHPNKSRHWIAAKYWHRDRGSWDFAVPGARLHRHDRTPIRRHVKVQGARSPFDGDWVYWAHRLGRHPTLPRRVAILLQRQRGRCAGCGLYFRAEDLPEVDHIIPTAQGGSDRYRNWQLLHQHCHDQKTARDGSQTVGRYR